MEQRKSKKTLVQEMISLVDECIVNLLFLLLVHYSFISDVGNTVRKLYGGSVSSGVFSITIHTIVRRQQQVFTVSIIPFIALSIGLIVMRLKMKRQLTEHETETDAISTPTENTKNFVRNMIGLANKCIIASSALVLTHYAFLFGVRKAVGHLYRTTVTSGLISITFYNGVQKHRIFHVGLISLIAIFTGLIATRKEMKSQLKEPEICETAEIAEPEDSSAS